MKRYKVELIKDFDFSSELEFLSSPLGRFCREIHHKKWLEADEGSIGHQLIRKFVAALNLPDCLATSLYEVDMLAEFTEEMETREHAENALIQAELERTTRPPRIPRYSAYRTINGKRQGLIGFNWVDIPE